MSELVFDPISETRDRLGVSGVEAQALFWTRALVLFGVLVANQTHIESNDQVKLAAMPELAIRLGFTGLAGLIGAYGLLFVKRVQDGVLRFPAAWIVGISFFYLVATICSPYKGTAAPHFITFICIMLFTPTAFAVLGTRRFIQIVFCSIVFTLIASWFLYLFVPVYGVVTEITDESGASVDRMGGTSHPNVLAGINAIFLMILAFLYFEKKLRLAYVLPFLVLCGMTVYATQSRVSPVAAVLSIIFVYRAYWFKTRVFPLTMLLIAAGVAGILLMAATGIGIESESLTRSGDTAEITSLTGRSDIWAYIVEKIGESPLIGYGPGTAKILLDEKDMLLHPHNVVLCTTVTAGVICGAFTIMMFLQQIWVAIRTKYRMAALITFFIVLNSLTETIIFDYVPGTTTVLWLAALYWPSFDDDSL